MVIDEEVNDLKLFLYDTTLNAYTDDEVKIIISNKLLDF